MDGHKSGNRTIRSPKPIVLNVVLTRKSVGSFRIDEQHMLNPIAGIRTDEWRFTCHHKITKPNCSCWVGLPELLCVCGHVFACVMSVLWVGKWSLLTQTTLWSTHQVSQSGFPLRTSRKPPKKETRTNLYGSQHHGQLYLPFFLLFLNSSSSV